MMIRFVSLLLALIFVLSLTGCGGEKPSPAMNTPEQQQAVRDGMKKYEKNSPDGQKP